MTSFPILEADEVSSAQAYLVGNEPDHGYIRFRLAGKVRLFRLPKRVFELLGRQIHNVSNPQAPENPSQSQANTQE